MDIVSLLIMLGVGACVVWGAWWIITHYFAAPQPQKVILLVVGVLLLALMLIWFAGFLGHPITLPART